MTQFKYGGENMKHIFIVNPVSGKGNTKEIIRSEIHKIEDSFDIDVYDTKGVGDSERFIKSYLSEHNERTRFYACGGDGTVNEVVNGVAQFDHGSFAVYPCGSGNDFVKSFGTKEDFLDIAALVESSEIPIDIMKVNERYCINVCHFGFDTYVARKMNEIRSKPIIGGKNAYTTGVALGLLHAMKNNATIFCDGEKMNNGTFLLCTIGNGQYVGGKYKCAPRAVLNDGMLEVCLVDPVSRFTFVKLVNSYADGKHLDDPRFNTFLHYKRCNHIEIYGDEGFEVSLDGEVTPAPHAKIDVIPGGINMALPEKLLKCNALQGNTLMYSKKIGV